jgi:hypothetical protein
MYSEERFLQKLEDSKSTSQHVWCYILQKWVPYYERFLNDVLFHNKTFNISYYETTDHSPVFFVGTNRYISSYPYFLFEYYFMQKRVFSQECISTTYRCTHFFIGA